jgi:hypothetical protein
VAELLHALKRLNVDPTAGETLDDLVARAAQTFPALNSPLNELAASHAERRYGPAMPRGEQRRARQRWQLALRQVKQARIDAISRSSGSSP